MIVGAALAMSRPALAQKRSERGNDEAALASAGA
jgi:hypothetical protein